MKKTSVKLISLIHCLCFLFAGCGVTTDSEEDATEKESTAAKSTERVDVEAPYSGDVVIGVNTSVSPEDLQFSGRLPLTNVDESALENLKENAGNSIEGYKGDGVIEYETQPSKTYQVGDTLPITTRDFYQWMQMNEDGTRPSVFYDVNIELVYSGQYCTVWGQKGDIGEFSCDFTLGEDVAKRIADEFDKKMFPFMTESFGNAYDIDKDGKVAIVCLDLIDYYDYEIYDNYYFNGYCDPSFWFTNDGKTKMDSIILDLWPTLYNEEGKTTDENWNLAMVTLVHEYQHLINYSNYVTSPNQAKPMQDWLNEGFSVIAENMYTGNPPADFIEFYKSDNDGLLANGRSPMQYEGTWEDYALVYYLSLYLLEQTKDCEGGGKEIFKTILESDDYDYHAVENALKKIGYPVTNFSDFLFNFRVALVANEDSGVYSFNKNVAVQNLPPHIFSVDNLNADDIRLNGFTTMIPGGGGAILFQNDGEFTPAGQGEDVHFAGITLERQ